MRRHLNTKQQRQFASQGTQSDYSWNILTSIRFSRWAQPLCPLWRDLFSFFCFYRKASSFFFIWRLQENIWAAIGLLITLKKRSAHASAPEHSAAATVCTASYTK